MRGIPAVGGRTSHRYQYMPFTSYQVPDTVPGKKKKLAAFEWQQAWYSFIELFHPQSPNQSM